MAANRIGYIKNGVLRFPPGFRFHPTDEELILQYLMRRAFSLPLPAPVISDVDGCRFDPWVLPGNFEREKYFFSTKLPKFPNGRSSNRVTASGYWKATGIDRPVLSSKQDQLLGWKKTLVFYIGKSPFDMRTDWIMHEYRLVDFPPSAINAQLPPFNTNWVICRIFFKKRDIRETDENNNVCSRPVFHDFLRATNDTDLNLSPSSSSSSGSSGITDISEDNPEGEEEEDDEEDEEEETSSYDTLEKGP